MARLSDYSDNQQNNDTQATSPKTGCAAITFFLAACLIAVIVAAIWWVRNELLPGEIDWTGNEAPAQPAPEPTPEKPLISHAPVSPTKSAISQRQFSMTLRSSKTQLVKVSRNFGNDDIVLVCNDIVSDGIPETFRTGGEIRVEADDIQAVSIEIGGKKFLPAPNDEGSFVFTPALTE